MTEPNFMHQPTTQKLLPLFSRTCISNPLRISPQHAWHPVSLQLPDKPTALWSPNALEPPVPDDFSEHILWTCLTTWDTQKLAKVSIHTLPKTTRWNNLVEYKHQYQVPIIRCCPSSITLVNLLPAVQLLPHCLLDLPHRNQPLLLQQEKPTDSRYFALRINGIGHSLGRLVPVFASLKSPKGVPEQATEPWWKPQPGLHSNAAYTMVQAPFLCYGTNASKSQVSPERRCYTVSNQNLKASCSRGIPRPKASTPVWTIFLGSPIHGISSHPLSSNPACFGLSRRLKNWSPASANTQLSSLSQGDRNTLSSQHHLTTILPTHPRHPPPPQL